MASKRNLEFAKRVKDTREMRSMSGSDLARLTNVTPAAVWNWETNGVIPRAETLALLAQVLGVEKDFLLSGEGRIPQGRNNLHLEALPLEDLMKAIEAKGFSVSVSPRSA